MFAQCSNLRKVNIPTGMTALAGGLFRDCSSLTEITIPSNITTLGDSVFNGCSGITSLVIPDSVVQIGTKTGIEGRIWSASTFAGMTSLTSITLPAGLTVVGAGLFKNCTNLTTVYIPEGVTEIGPGAFEGSGVVNIVFLGGDTSGILLRDGAIPAGGKLFSEAEWKAWQEEQGKVPGSQEPSGTPGASGVGPAGGSTGGDVLVVGGLTDGEAVDGAQTDAAKEAEASAQPEAPAARQELGASAEATEQAEEAEEAPEQRLSMVDVVRKTLAEPVVRTGLVVVVALGLVSAVVGGGVYRARKFKEQVK